MKKQTRRKKVKNANRFGVTDIDVNIIKSVNNREISEKNSV
jgi:hypothetical protein